MTAHQVWQETTRNARGCPAPADPGFLEVWARCAPIRLAGYEDDLAEPHILQGVD
ncbi:hypothetical protein OG920_45720 [Streptomyces europaeiscabiei]|uniref:hypothetical protein n=1 Tax=Streptomyces TaxID=1883 RepID=UPI0015C4EF86|nr:MULTISPECIES: hypothetical protein [Streptomyces]MDX3588681.1 hypothetical protein [Streptomyces europaeiscabiei]MDX3616092.1 hypothetical protein [Streptomyces europaeiscabiei]MDX3637589.1 hypothetical protein [Streptomyces europaeiscabiei]MDX3652904.1 hypothetical protein [Streptomyces europaeiscabiei]WUD38765.1 hypothetical protein OG858_00490 [Streptomyces europaeiscabiei]